MKQMTIPAALAALALVLGASSSEAQSQTTTPRAPRTTAAHVAAQVQSFYDQTTTVRTAFSQAHRDRLYGRTTRSRGILTVSRPGKMRFDYLGGNGKVVVTDGAQLTVYEPDDDGGPGQYARTALTDGMPSALGFLAGTARLDEDFTFRLRDPAQFNWAGHVLELRPRSAEPGYRRVFLYVDASRATAGVVRRVLIQDHAGNLNRFDFQRMRFNAPVASEDFAFEPPRGARRI